MKRHLQILCCALLCAVGVRAGTKPAVGPVRTDDTPQVVLVFGGAMSNLFAGVGGRWGDAAVKGGDFLHRAFRSKRHDAFNAGKNKLAVIVAGNKAGTGFLLREAGRIWLVTNAHVVKGAPRVTAAMLDGTTLALGTCQYAQGRDLARFPVTGRTQAFELNRALPSIGDRVTVLGNTDGRGVITEIKGRVTGVGPLEIEIDAAFTTGNSGSPVLDAQGRVLAVASYLRNCRNDADWSKRGTRFNGIRRFALRLTGVRWDGAGKNFKPEK